MDCVNLTQYKIDQLTAEHKYKHIFQWWSPAHKILAARKTIFSDVKPQHMQSGTTLYKYAYDKTIIGPIERPVYGVRCTYFDLGGEYDLLLDDMQYDKLLKCIDRR